MRYIQKFYRKKRVSFNGSKHRIIQVQEKGHATCKDTPCEAESIGQDTLTESLEDVFVPPKKKYWD